MKFEIVEQLTIPVIVIACLVTGFMLKNYVPLNNKHIPLLMACLGIGINIIINGYISFTETIIAGALSGVISTGLHQIFSKYVDGKLISKKVNNVDKDSSDKDTEK
ncbi:phage holin family protein [Erysipelothrix anatis]|uniref:phage holin family protein n=1 Tax=Erysipelothrix anatis TaxID=2683713 RepID=UPI0014097E0E|nr:phage holin family protein [Erysipelothrix anatis]